LGGEAGDVVGEVVGRRIGGVAGRGLVVFAHQGEIEVVGGHGKNSMLPEKPLMGCAGVGGGWAVFARSEAGPPKARGGDAVTTKPVRLNRFSKVAARLGLEPRQSESESLVLPLHHRAKMIVKSACGMEPAMGFEPATACLQNRCST